MNGKVFKFCVSMVVVSIQCGLAWADASIRSPQEGGLAIGDTLRAQVILCKKGRVVGTRVDRKAVASTWFDSAYGNLVETDLDLTALNAGEHELEVTLQCKRRGRQVVLRRHFSKDAEAGLPMARALADHYLQLVPASELVWDWEDAVFLYGLSVYAKRDPSMREYAQGVLSRFNSSWLSKGLPKINRSDRVAPGLAALIALRDHGDASAQELLDPVLYYLRNEPRNALGALDHLGHWWLSKFYPSSIWVDSLMMYGVLSIQLGQHLGDQELYDFGVNQAAIFANALQDESTGLFWHAYLVRSGKTMPRKHAFWLRGNGWVTTALVETLEALAPGDPRFAEAQGILKRQVEGLKKYQQPSGLWDSILNAPGFSYEETSGAALVAYGVAKAVRLGFLPQEDLPMAQKAFAGVVAQLERTPVGYSMTGVSAATNAFGKLSYRRVKRSRDEGYGVGALLLAASELTIMR